MAMQRDEIEAYVDAASILLDVRLDPAHRPGVLKYFELAAGMATLVAGLPLAADAEPAGVFVPVSPAR